MLSASQSWAHRHWNWLRFALLLLDPPLSTGLKRGIIGISGDAAFKGLRGVWPFLAEGGSWCSPRVSCSFLCASLEER